MTQMTNLQTMVRCLIDEVNRREVEQGYEPNNELPDPRDCQIMADALRSIGVDPDAWPPPFGWKRRSAEWRAMCEEQWPDCVDDEYNPACCRFPKRCSCGPFVPPDPGRATT
jgi:hypothetical protein